MTIANFFTMIRLLLSPVLLWAFFISSRTFVIMIWVLAALTDFLDGWAARKFNQVSVLGKVLDPIADKFTVGFSLLGLMIWGDLPFWLVIAYFGKELLQLFGGAYLLYKKDELQASNLWGKTGTVLFFTGFFFFFWLKSIGSVFIGLGLVVSYIAFYTYAKTRFSSLSRSKKTKA